MDAAIDVDAMARTIVDEIGLVVLTPVDPDGTRSRVGVQIPPGL